MPENETLKYIEQCYDVLEWWIEKQPDSEEAGQLFQLWMTHIMHIYRKSGFWVKIEKVYKTFVNRKGVISNDGDYDLVENYVSALHQQGKTEDAIRIIETALSEVRQNNSIVKVESIIEWGLNRMSKFYFYLDNFESARKCLSELKDYCELHRGDKYGTIKMPLTAFVELMTANVELDDVEKYAEMENKLKESELDLGATQYTSNALVRSKYLITQSALITNHYHLVFKVCIKRPVRPEGEYEKSENDLVRKLDHFYVECFFENPAGGEPLTITQEVKHFDFEIHSPNFEIAAKPYNWYSTKLYLYEDSTKQQLLGKHFQMVYLEPAAAQRRRGGK